MSIQAKKLKKTILKSGSRIGILVEKNSPVDRAITNSATTAATLINGSEKQLQMIATKAKSGLDELRAKIHAATEPRNGK
jgi:hypothetical protein